MLRPLALFALSPVIAGAQIVDLGKTVFVGDSITQGGGSSAGYVPPSYRYDLWKYMVDNGTACTFVGSQTGPYAGGGTPNTANYRGESFSNIHEGHYGWRASWENGRVNLPGGRYDTNNLGQGTVANWTGQSAIFNGSIAYTGRNYIPDTVIVMIGVNDIADGTAPAQTEADILQIVRQYQTANANARVYVCSVLNVSNNHGSAAAMLPALATLNTNLAANAAGWSTGNSTVSFIDTNVGFDATKMTYDNTHLNYAGERVVAGNIAGALGVGARDTSIGLQRKAAGDFAIVTPMTTLPGTTAGKPLFRKGATGAWTLSGNGAMLNASGGAAYLQSDWALASGAAYTVEVALKMLDNGKTNNDFVIWTDDGVGGASAGFLRIYADRTEWGYSGGSSRLALDFSDNTDALHVFRVAYDGSAYAVWRDAELLADGLAGDSGAGSQNWLVLGNFTGSETGYAYLEYAAIDTAGAYAAIPEPSTYALALAGVAGVAVLAAHRRRKSNRF